MRNDRWGIALAGACAAAACGGGNNETTLCPDSGPACTSECTATFTGNIVDESGSTANCATVTAGTGGSSSDELLGFSLASKVIGAPFGVSIDLGASPSAGTFSSDTVTTWSAEDLRVVGSGGCAYSAGADGVPTGSFALTLTTIGAAGGSAHGELRIVTNVQAQQTTDCGSGDTETVDVQF